MHGRDNWKRNTEMTDGTSNFNGDISHKKRTSLTGINRWYDDDWLMVGWWRRGWVEEQRQDRGQVSQITTLKKFRRKHMHALKLTSNELIKFYHTITRYNLSHVTIDDSARWQRATSRELAFFTLLCTLQDHIFPKNNLCNI